MANIKKLGTSKVVPGNTVYCIVRREVDAYRLNDADGTFTTAPADPYLSLTEDSIIKGLYEVSESRAAWNAGQYKVFIYIQAGASPSPADDALTDLMEFYVVGDRIVMNFPFESGKVATDAGNSIIVFKTDLALTTNDYCVGSFLKFVSGNLNNQVRRISAYNGTSKNVTLSAAFTAIPAAGDEFFLVNQ